MNVVSPETPALRAFNGTLAKAIDETISGVLGQNVLESFYEHLEVFYSLRRDEVPRRPDAVSLVLEKNFGSTAGTVLGRAVARRLYHELKLKFTDIHNGKLPEYVEQAKSKLAIERPDEQAPLNTEDGYRNSHR